MPQKIRQLISSRIYRTYSSPTSTDALPHAASALQPIGECGLDFNRNFSPPDVQEAWFRSQARSNACCSSLYCCCTQALIVACSHQHAAQAQHSTQGSGSARERNTHDSE